MFQRVIQKIPDKWAAILLFSTTGCITSTLAAWQYQRRDEKQAYLDRIQGVLDGDVSPCPSRVKMYEWDKMDFTKVIAEGILDTENQILVGPQKQPGTPGLLSTPGEFGGYLYTPLHLDSGDTIFLMRGYTPFAELENCLEPTMTKEGRFKCIGLLRRPPHTSEYIPQLKREHLNDIKWPFLRRSDLIERYNLDLKDGEDFVTVIVLDPDLRMLRQMQLEEELGSTDEEIVRNIMRSKASQAAARRSRSFDELDPDTVFPMRYPQEEFLNVTVRPDQHMAYVATWGSLAVMSFYYTARCFRNPKFLSPSFRTNSYRDRVTKFNASLDNAQQEELKHILNQEKVRKINK